MFIYDQNYLLGSLNTRLFSWSSSGSGGLPPSTSPIQYYFSPPFLFEGRIFDWSPGATSQLGGWGGIGGSVTPPVVGNLQFVFDGGSFTNGKVLAFNDGIINVPLIQITKATYPIVQACIQILKAVGKPGRTYKLDIVRNGVILFTVRSVYWGTQMATDTDPKYQIIDNQLRATSTPFL